MSVENPETENAPSAPPVAAADVVSRWLTLTESAIGNASDRLNAINIFPVADGDTGSNLYDTIAVARRAVDDYRADHGSDETTTIGDVLAVAGDAALDHAHGNSGTLLAVIINALAEPLSTTTRLTAPALTRGLDRARTAAWAALSDPQEGTILSVLNDVTDAAHRTLGELPSGEEDQLNSRRTLHAVCASMVAAAHEAVRKTEEQLDELTEAHVVDAGGIGLLLVLEALYATVSRTDVNLDALHEFSGFNNHQEQVTREVEEGWEIMCSLELTPLDAATLRIGLNDMGDSVIMTPSTTTSPADEGEASTIKWRIHVHVPQPDPALELLRQAAGGTELDNLHVSALHCADHSHDHS